ncbi:hypothetical protein C9I57_07480 [Trinickia symbiotica]|uniref:Uncharacterized protein n=1 Tax=Trinickia symbiotica TaxID=863227 RepID=A0A2T3XYA1_9BURK|nr:hypothetical protein [Trinickia symbiotica]PTB21484.1 hypothetical protein C9I57_07480 [Trinickia symbiotica]
MVISLLAGTARVACVAAAAVALGGCAETAPDYVKPTATTARAADAPQPAPSLAAPASDAQ